MLGNFSDKLSKYCAENDRGFEYHVRVKGENCVMTFDEITKAQEYAKSIDPEDNGDFGYGNL